ncbi:hypothetical protein FGB62_66g119 [Gracilaria domingensis]|nr:hypothetical protein FGB62_66g119 [Gracilaria domingensis]
MGLQIAGFLAPAPARLADARSRCARYGRNIARCSAKVKPCSTSRHRRLTVDAPKLNNYPHDLLNELRHLVRCKFGFQCAHLSFIHPLTTPSDDLLAPSFISRVRERIKWPYFRFSGVLFGRVDVTLNDDGTGGDGVPDALRQLASRVDIKFIDIPPLLVQRAATRANQQLGTQHPRIVAVFETYGHPKKVLLDLQNQRSQFEIDLQKQHVAWSDRGDIRRNETKIMSLHGAESFDDDYLDYYL